MMRSKEAIVTVFAGVTEVITPPVTAVLTFDPKDVKWDHTGSDGEGSLYSWTPILNPLISRSEREPFPWIYGHKSTLSSVLAYSTQQVSSYMVSFYAFPLCQGKSHSWH